MAFNSQSVDENNKKQLGGGSKGASGSSNNNTSNLTNSSGSSFGKAKGELAKDSSLSLTGELSIGKDANFEYDDNEWDVRGKGVSYKNNFQLKQMK